MTLFFLLLTAVLAAFQVIIIQATVASKDINQLLQDADWKSWKKMYKRTYTPPEEFVRYDHWVANFNQVYYHNLRYEKGKEFYMQGMTKFSDRSPDDLHRQLLREVPVGNFVKNRKPVVLQPDPVPRELNWSVYGWTSPMKNLKFYPFGWLFSAIAAIQAQYFNATGFHINLSAKEILDCTEKPRGRHFISLDAFSYILAKKVTLDAFYPIGYFPDRKPCKSEQQHPKISITNYHVLQPDDEENLKIAVALIGPISVSIRVTPNFLFYMAGVFYDPACKADVETINHAVLLVGYGTDGNKGDFWIIQNSWGTLWGENGFARMTRNSIINCGIAAGAMYPVIA